jgi:hypothetical protein
MEKRSHLSARRRGSEHLPSNAPTGGWQVLNTTQGIPVKLPATVEQFYWALQGLRPYRDEYKFEADDPAVNGNYLGFL